MPAIEVEAISDGDSVSRNVYFPLMYGDASELVWKEVFPFPGGQCESVVWRKYAPEDADVHTIGVKHEERKRELKPEWTYTGFISAIVQDIRNIKSAAGHGFEVDHAPECDADHHTHICYLPANDAEPSTLKKSEKSDLKAWLKRAFGCFTEFSAP